MPNKIEEGPWFDKIKSGGVGAPVCPAVSPHAFNDLGINKGGLDIYFNPELFTPQNLINEKI